MKASQARHVLRVLDGATEDLLRSHRRVRRSSSSLATGLHSSYVSKVLGDMSPLVVYLWEQHPPLAPVDDGETHHAPQLTFMSRAQVLQAAEALQEADKRVARLERWLARSEMASSERRRVERWVAALQLSLRQALFTVRQQHPDFYGPSPKKDILFEMARRKKRLRSRSRSTRGK